MDSCDRSTKWYAINTNPRCEDMVYHILSTESFEALFPKIPKKYKTGRQEPLFPGYLFVRLNLKLPDWVRINYLPGVRKIVSFGNTPTPVPEGIIAAIVRRIAGGDYSSWPLPFKAGDKVRFESGPFVGLEGKFTGTVSGKERVKVLLEALQRSFTVEVEAAQLCKTG